MPKAMFNGFNGSQIYQICYAQTYRYNICIVLLHNCGAYRKKRVRFVHYTQSNTHASGIVVTATIIQSDLDESNDERKVRWTPAPRREAIKGTMRSCAQLLCVAVLSLVDARVWFLVHRTVMGTILCVRNCINLLAQDAISFDTNMIIHTHLPQTTMMTPSSKLRVNNITLPTRIQSYYTIQKYARVEQEWGTRKTRNQHRLSSVHGKIRTTTTTTTISQENVLFWVCAIRFSFPFS